MGDLPGPLRLTSAFPFVGRSAEVEALRTLVPTAVGEGRRVVLLSGEPGSGKTRLVREFGRAVAGDGVRVLYGACDPVVRTPYGPFVEALDHLARVTEPAALRAAMGPGGGELTRLLPDLPLRIGELPSPVRADPDTERHRLHTAVADLLAGVTRERPALLVLEDGHWADASTLLLLRYLARAAGNARVLLLATFRDTEAEVPETLAETLADLRRSDDVVRLRLEGLSPEEVTDLVRAATGGEPGPELRELAQAIHDLTRGNAFLVCELWRALVEADAVETADGRVRVARAPAELGSPQSVREVVSQRLCRLAPRTSDLLELAATAGTAFDLGVLRRAARLEEAELPAAFDEAVRSGMIEELPSPVLPAASRMNWCGGPSTTACPASAGRSSTSGSPKRSRLAVRTLGGRWPTSRTTSRRPPPSGTASGQSGTTSKPRVLHPPLSPSTRPLPACIPRLNSGSSTPALARTPCLSWAAPAIAAARRPTRSRRLQRPRTLHAKSVTRSCSPARRSATKRLAGVPASPTRAPSSYSWRRQPLSATNTPSCGSACSAGLRARSTSGATTVAAR